LGASLCLLKIRLLFEFWYEPFLQIYSLIAAGYVFSRVLLSMFYREPSDKGHLPNVSIVIAARNEEAHIVETIRRSYQSNYPDDRLEVLVVDDGSTDGTWTALQSIRATYPAIKLFQFEENKGKRKPWLLAPKKRRARFWFMSIPTAMSNPKGSADCAALRGSAVGAVSGHVLVAVEPHNFISKMESVRYYVSHRVMKAAESLFGSVTCCPGAFSHTGARRSCAFCRNG